MSTTVDIVFDFYGLSLDLDASLQGCIITQ